MSEESDALGKYVAGFVRERVPPEHRAVVSELVARTLVLMMTNPQFLEKLTVIRALREENWRLRQALAVATAPRPPRKAPAKKKAAKAAPRKAVAKKVPAKKAAPRKAPAKNTRAKNMKAFKRGASGR